MTQCATRERAFRAQPDLKCRPEQGRRQGHGVALATPACGIVRKVSEWNEDSKLSDGFW